MPDRSIVSYVAFGDEGFNCERLISVFEKGGFTLEHSSSGDLRGFSAQGDSLRLNRSDLLHIISSRIDIGFSFWMDDSTDCSCTIKTKGQVAKVTIDLRGTEVAEMLNVLVTLMKYLTVLDDEGKLLGIVGDFVGAIEDPNERDRLFIR